MKKKLIAVLMIAVLTLSLAACQGKDDSKDTSKKEKTEDSSDKKAAPKKEQKTVEITLPASLVGDSEATLDAVSYTHLDVYKRQTYIPAFPVSRRYKRRSSPQPLR